MTDAHLPQLPEQISFASELIKSRSEMGFTQAQLAQKSGLSLSAIKAYEAGRNMPGARELRELCQALQVSPNKLLFGNELPFRARSVADMLASGETQDEKVVRARIAILSTMLAADERDSLLRLAFSIALARHGEAKVREALDGATVMALIAESMTTELRNFSNVPGYQLDSEAVAKSIEEALDRYEVQKRDPEKLPEK